MKKILSFIVVIFISACSLPISTPHVDAQISTNAAMTVQAAMLEAQTPLATPTLFVEESAAPIPTSTEEKAMASVGDVVNCRTGPGTSYERIAQILPEQPVEIAGFFPSNYWIVKIESGECWLAAEFVTPSGAFGAVPRVTAPPTPLGGSPDAPSFSKNGWTWFCNGAGDVDVELNWNDNSNSETGYRVYRNNELVVELAANSTFFKETVIYPGGMGLQYKVEAFNASGAESASTQVLFCQ